MHHLLKWFNHYHATQLVGNIVSINPVFVNNQYDLALNDSFGRYMYTNVSLIVLSGNKTEGRYHIYSLEMKACRRCHLALSSIETDKKSNK